MNVEIGQLYQLNGTKYNYEVLDIIGGKKYLPDDGNLIFFRLRSKAIFFQQLPQTFITLPERQVSLLFTKVK